MVIIAFSVSANPPPSFMWMRNGEVVGNDSVRVVNTSSIMLNPADRSHAGMYRLVVNNSVGTADYNFTLDVLCKYITHLHTHSYSHTQYTANSCKGEAIDLSSLPNLMSRSLSKLLLLSRCFASMLLIRTTNAKKLSVTPLARPYVVSHPVILRGMLELHNIGMGH